MEGRPTKIQIEGADTPIGLRFCALLCQLGYDVVVPLRIKETKTGEVLQHFYNLTFSAEPGDFIFKCDDRSVTIGMVTYIQAVQSTTRFVNFCIYHWGLTRGFRGLYTSPIYVDVEKTQKWDLLKYV